jgi:hypothetical protein
MGGFLLAGPVGNAGAVGSMSKWKDWTPNQKIVILVQMYGKSNRVWYGAQQHLVTVLTLMLQGGV